MLIDLFTLFMVGATDFRSVFLDMGDKIPEQENTGIGVVLVGVFVFANLEVAYKKIKNKIRISDAENHVLFSQLKRAFRDVFYLEGSATNANHHVKTFLTRIIYGDMEVKENKITPIARRVVREAFLLNFLPSVPTITGMRPSCMSKHIISKRLQDLEKLEQYLKYHNRWFV